MGAGLPPVARSGAKTMKSYRTKEIAMLGGVHPNTVRFYEEMGLLPPVERKPNGYRVFTDRHLRQIRLIRTALRSEILAAGLREMVLSILKSAANEDGTALTKAYQYRQDIMAEKGRAEEAIAIIDTMLHPSSQDDSTAVPRTRREMAMLLGITPDVLRDWERNGLINVPCDANGHRLYGTRQMRRLKVIRTLRNANYSQMAILRMLTQLVAGRENLRAALDTPGPEEDIITATDRYLTALDGALSDADSMIGQLEAK